MMYNYSGFKCLWMAKTLIDFAGSQKVLTQTSLESCNE